MRSIPPAVLLALAVSACSHAHAKTAPEKPALDVPAPPPHDVEATETEPPPPISLPQEPAHNPPARQRPAPPPQPPRADAPHPEAPRQEPPPPAAEQPKPEEPIRNAAPLQTMPTTAEGDAERQIRATVQRASADLSRVDYRALNKDARTQYDTAKRFISQVDEAIHQKNLLFAKNLADKAATLAAQLASR